MDTLNDNSVFMPWWESNHQRFDAVMFDIDGTLIAGGRALPGAGAVIKWMEDHHFPFRLLTNDGNHSQMEKSAMIKRAGLSLRPEEIVSCGMAIGAASEERGWRGETFHVLGDLGAPCYAELGGLRVSREVESIAGTRGIIIGEGEYDWRLHLNAVINELRRNPGKPLVVPNPDSYWPNGSNGEIGVGAGGKARFIVGILAEMNVEIEPIYLGKPHPAIFHLGMEVVKRDFQLSELRPERTLMIGDSLRSDIAGANRVGMSSALVLTGITNRAQAGAAPEERRPARVFNRLG